MPGMEYVMWNAPSGPAGGLRKPAVPEEAEHPMVYNYIAVDDIDAALGQIEKMGGKVIISKTEISPEIGYYAIFTDPDGNFLGLQQEPKKEHPI